MYNGIGLQTARGSGTSGYTQSNKFFAKPKVSGNASSHKPLESDQGTGGVTRKANEDILEHDRKRQVELKLLVLEEELIDQGFTDSEVAEKLDEARRNLEAPEDGDSNAFVSGSKVSDTQGFCSRVSDTQSHQVAPRKVKQMETLRAALGIGSETENPKQQHDELASDSEDINDDDKPTENNASGGKKQGEDVKEEEYGRKNAKGYKKHRISGHSSDSENDPNVDDRKRKQKKIRRHDGECSYSVLETESEAAPNSHSDHDRKYVKFH